MTHIHTYTRADGTLVKEHEDRRIAAPWWVKVLNRARPQPRSLPMDYHVQAGDHGERVKIHHPHVATPEITWKEKTAIATFTPNGPVPKAMNGVPFAPWTPPSEEEGWAQVDGQLAIHEPPMALHGKLEPAAGVLIEEDDGRVWVIHPTNEFGGYKATFPKGHQEEGLPLQAVAIKEAFEESGLKVEITGFAGDVARSTTVCRYYTARRVGGTPEEMGWESQAVSLVPRSRLYEVLNRPVDHDMAEALGAGTRPAPPPRPPVRTQTPWWDEEGEDEG